MGWAGGVGFLTALEGQVFLLSKGLSPSPWWLPSGSFRDYWVGGNEFWASMGSEVGARPATTVCRGCGREGAMPAFHFAIFSCSWNMKPCSHRI